MKKHLRDLIEKLQEIHGDAIVGKELYGYKESIPEYRIILGKIMVDGIDANDNIVKNHELSRPKEFPDSLYFDNFRKRHFYNGLYYFEEQFESMVKHDFDEVEVSMLNNIVKEGMTITRGYLKLPDKDLIKMLNSIEEALNSK